MLSRSATGPFNSDAWNFEIKWDGVRAIAYIDHDISLKSRNDRELTGQFPELAELRTLAPHTVLDGEIVVMSGGRPDIQALLPRLQAGTGSAAPVRVKNPVTYIIFDILEKDGKPLLDLPFFERRKILENSVREGPHVILSVPVEARGEEYYNAAIAKGLEGVMAKRKDSPYEPGLRSGAWLKIKAEKTCDCVIAGYTPGQGGRGPTFGALILGLYEQEPGEVPSVKHRISSPVTTSPSPPAGNNLRRLVYIGKVGTGFSDRDLSDLQEIFSPLRTDIPQVAGVEPSELLVWLTPVLVCEVAYQMVTRDKKLRIPRFVRMRPDRRPEECSTDQLKEVRIAVDTGGPDTEQAGYKKPGGVISRKGRSPETVPPHGDRSHEVPEGTGT